MTDKELLLRMIENIFLYGNPYGPVHGPTPKGILSYDE